MNLFQLLVLGIVQGITEWIPVSSKTQVTFVYLKFFQGDPSLVIPVLLYVHLGTVIAATLYFRTQLFSIARTIAQNPRDIRRLADGTTGFLVTALACTGIVGLPLLVAEKKFLPSLDAGLLYALMGAGLIVTGVLLLSHRVNNTREAVTVTWKDGVLTGLLQGFSVLPGISRSGTSTTGLIWRGFDSGSSFSLSFLLSIPTVIFAEILLDYGTAGITALPFADGAVLLGTSFVAGYLTLEGMLALVRRFNIAAVVLALGAIIILVGLFGIG